MEPTKQRTARPVPSGRSTNTWRVAGESMTQLARDTGGGLWEGQASSMWQGRAGLGWAPPRGRGPSRAWTCCRPLVCPRRGRVSPMRSSRPPLGRPGEHPCVGDLLGRPTLLLVLTCLWIGWQACAGATWQVLARTRCHATPCHAMPRCLVVCYASPRLASRKVPSCGSGLGSQPSQAKPGQLGWSCAAPR